MSKEPRNRKKRQIFVLDTNVLLYNPRAIFAFPGAEVIIPDQVLGELDRLKTARADKELRFRGREFARILFDLSESGKLIDGIPFGENSILRVVTFDSHNIPDPLSGKNTDDRILTIVYQLQKEEPGSRVTIVTNDLNMLVKAQMLDIPVTRSGEDFAYGPFRRSIVWLNSQKRALSLMAVVLALAVAILFSQKFLNPTSGQPQAPPQLMAQLQQYQNQEYGYQLILDKNPKDVQALVGMGDVNSSRGDIYQDTKYYEKASEFYKKALDIDSKNVGVRLKLGIEYDRLGMYDIALREVEKVLALQPNNPDAQYYAGAVLMDKQDYKGALAHFKKYQEIAPTGPESAQVSHYIDQLNGMISQSGGPRSGQPSQPATSAPQSGVRNQSEQPNRQ
ncbi:MAG: PIN domain-containing protein [Actinobacteria bacterium]|nr:PIN domain-containing protein [Actinomycetota bacterium]